MLRLLVDGKLRISAWKLNGGINSVKELTDQYKNSSNLDIRIKIHDLYSTNKKDWFSWLFEQYEIQQNSRILELGCGNGTFWVKNEDRISRDWDLTLSDFSSGMLEDAQNNLKNIPNIQYEHINIQNIPYENDSFDVIIANYMLYHVPDRKQALQEVCRVLKPGGVFYTSTIGKDHLTEFGALLREFDSTLDYSSASTNAKEFGLENGEAQLAPYFPSVKLKKFPGGLRITEVQAIVDYLLSTNTNLKSILVGEKIKEFNHFLEVKKQKNGGFINITKSTGLFESK